MEQRQQISILRLYSAGSRCFRCLLTQCDRVVGADSGAVLGPAPGTATRSRSASSSGARGLRRSGSSPTARRRRRAPGREPVSHQQSPGQTARELPAAGLGTSASRDHSMSQRSMMRVPFERGEMRRRHAENGPLVARCGTAGPRMPGKKPRRGALPQPLAARATPWPTADRRTTPRIPAAPRRRAGHH